MEIRNRCRKMLTFDRANDPEKRLMHTEKQDDAPSLRGDAPQEGRKPFPTTGDLLALMGIFLVANLATGIVAGVIGLATGGDAAEGADAGRKGLLLAATYAVSMTLTLGGALVYRRARGGRAPLARFSVRGLDPAVLGWAFVLMLAVGIVVEPLTARLPGPPYEALGRGAWTFAALAVLAPLFEELLCRGVVLEAVRARHGAVRAWLVSSLFFGVMHLYPAQAVGAFAVGLVLGYVCIATRSLWGAVVLHALNNALAYALMTAGYADATFADAIGSRWAYAVLYAAALALAVVSGRRIRAALRRLDGRADKNRQAA